MLAEGPTFGINGSSFLVNQKFGSPEKNLILILVKQTQNCAWVCIIMLITVRNI